MSPVGRRQRCLGHAQRSSRSEDLAYRLRLPPGIRRHAVNMGLCASGRGSAVVGHKGRGSAGGPRLQQHGLAGARQAVCHGLLELRQHAAVVRRWRDSAQACWSSCRPLYKTTPKHATSLGFFLVRESQRASLLC